MDWFIIAVSGTPGTGKTTLAKYLSKKFSLKYFDVTGFIKKNNLSEKFDKKRNCLVVDEKVLSKKIVQEIKKQETRALYKILVDKKEFSKQVKNFLKTKIPKKIPKTGKKNNKTQIFVGIIIDSHLSHFLPKNFVDLCIITKTKLKKKKKRLQKRKYSEKKIKENLEAEIFDTCFEEALQKKHEITIFNN